MNRQSLLLTAHKGVDLHAATALRVMRDRLEGGSALRALYRCELHVFRVDAADGGGRTMDQVLDTGRYFNPNKHHYGHFEGPVVPALFGESGHGSVLAPDWQGRTVASDLDTDPKELYDHLLGGPPAAGGCCCDLVAFARGQESSLVSGVLWRLVLEADAGQAAGLGEKLAVARGRKQGLLINPHMEDWLVAVR